MDSQISATDVVSTANAFHHRLRQPLTALTVWGLLCVLALPCRGDDSGIEEQRLEVMRSRVQSIKFTGQVPPNLESQALFRYDDQTRGYIDGTVWRLGERGRPLAIVTSELTFSYEGSGKPRIVYDLLSLTDTRFRAESNDFRWAPGQSAIEFSELPQGPEPADSPTARLFQFRQLARRFTASQVVKEQVLHLRLLPRPIDRYVLPPSDAGDSGSAPPDGAVFLFTSGRMPGILLMIETVDGKWRFAAGRLSLPSDLRLELDGETVWTRPKFRFGPGRSYHATNAPVVIPGNDR